MWSSIGSLWEEGKLDLDFSLGTVWPEVEGHALGTATARQLLTHTAGVPLRGPTEKSLRHRSAGHPRRRTEGKPLHRRPGEAVELHPDRAALILGYSACSNTPEPAP
ncbi:serine hydrolase [Streptomyces sp. L7]